MDYIYLALEYDFQLDTLEVKAAYTKKYNLKNWLEDQFKKKTTLVHLKCYRIRGAAVTEIDPYEIVKVDRGEA